ncbi:MAG: integrase [Sphingopyxis sp.]|nr:integrase [Sphingopyxis sp.]
MSDQPYTIQRFRGGYALVYIKPDGRRGRTQLASTDRPSAEAEARKVWEEADNSPWTVGRIVTAYLANRTEEGIASITRREDAWKAMKPFWDNVDPLLIDKAMVTKYSKGRNVGAATLRLELGMLSTSLNMAFKAGQIQRKPDIPLPAAPERIERHLTVRQFRRFMEGVRAPHARLYMQLGINTMARPSAILELKWSQVNFDRGLIDFNQPGRIQTKKKRPIVPMNRTLRAALETAYQARQTDYVIEHGSDRILCIKKAFLAASQRSGVKATPYTLRHTGAVWAAERGIPMSQLAQYMGHDDSRTTEKHYARYSPDYLRGVADALEIDILPGEVQSEPIAPVYKEA